MDKLSKLDNPIPIKAIPEEELNRIIITEFSIWVSGLLSLTGETSLERLKIALPAIKQHCWSLGLPEIKRMFEMYADGKLKTQPRPNYFDRILVGQIFNDYMAEKKTKPMKKDLDEEKRLQDMHNCIVAFDTFIQYRKITEEMTWIYTYLDEKGLLNFTPDEKKVLMKMGYDQKLTLEEAKLKSKRTLLRRYFERLEAKGEHIKDKL